MSVLADYVGREPFNIRVLSADGSRFVDLLVMGQEDTGLDPINDVLGREPLNVRLLSADGQSFIDPEAIGGGGGSGGGTIHTSAYTAPPATPVEGDQWWPNNTDYVGLYVGGVWLWRLHGHLITMPDNSLYSWYNQKAGAPQGSVDVSRGGIYLRAGKDTDGQVFRTKPLPATPYTIEAMIEPDSIPSNFTSWGLGVRNSGNHDFIEIGLYYESGVLKFNIGRGDDLTVTANNTIRDSTDRLFRWFQIRDDGTTRSYWVSEDGYHWVSYYAQPRTEDVTPDQAYFWINPRTTEFDYAGVWLRHWKES